jgi:hypothetical protein
MILIFELSIHISNPSIRRIYLSIYFYLYNIFFFSFSKLLNFPLDLKFYFELLYISFHMIFILSQNAHKIKSSMMHNLVAYIIINYLFLKMVFTCDDK